MKTLLFILLSSSAFGQYKLFTKNDLKVLPLLFAAGYTTGLREEVIQHPKAFMARHPHLNRNFWDNNVQGEKGFLNMEWNADHVLKAATATFFVAAVTFKTGEKKKWYLYFIDGVKSYLVYKAGFFVSYHLQEKNNF